ncbi:MAG: hypothetical protein Q4D56_05680 [Bacteroides sp.]|nr:hypothetical protein [Bacteroides sp.]
MKIRQTPLRKLPVGIQSFEKLLPYAADGKQVVKVGVSFDAIQRNLGEWLVV